MNKPPSKYGNVPAGGGQVPAIVRALSSEFLDRSAEFAVAMAKHLHSEIPELGGPDEELLGETRSSCESNIAQSYRLLQSGAPATDLVVTPEAREYVRGFVNRGLKVPVLLRTYRLGHAWIWENWSDGLRQRAADPDELTAAIEFSSRWMFAYIDLISAALVEDFAEQQARRVRSAEQFRATTVRAIFDGELVDDEAASSRLGYELRREHLSLHLWSDGDAAGGLERAASEAAETLGCSGPLVIACGATALDVWCSVGDKPIDEALAKLTAWQPPVGIRLAIGGGPHTTGLEGFRVARDEAREAARVGRLTGLRLAPITRFDDIELIGLLSNDPVRARRFVERRLGKLAADDEPTGRLRETVLAYLRCNRSSGQAAKLLFVHHNTVTYRVHRAEELLGRSVSRDQAELLCALILAEMIEPNA